MNPFEMVVAIVAISAVASVVRAKHGLPGRRNRANRFADMPTGHSDADYDAQQAEIKALKDRIAVLERVITDTNSAAALDREIEKLR